MTWRPRFSLRTLVIFLLFVTSGVGVWWRSGPWYLAMQSRFAGDTDSVPPWPQYGELGLREPLKREDLSTRSDVLVDSLGGSRLQLVVRMTEAPEHPDGGVWTIVSSELLLRDRETGEVLQVLDDRCGGHVDSAVLSVDGKAIITVARRGEIRMYRRRRPYEWWGVLWLWEFWLTAAFAGLFVWSVVRDRRALGKREAV